MIADARRRCSVRDGVLLARRPGRSTWSTTALTDFYLRAARTRGAAPAPSSSNAGRDADPAPAGARAVRRQATTSRLLSDAAVARRRRRRPRRRDRLAAATSVAAHRRASMPQHAETLVGRTRRGLFFKPVSGLRQPAPCTAATSSRAGCGRRSWPATTWPRR
ncbi:MAG: hypothetical protein MZU91_12625 [Desulfosudis oleivorans]|nr:hypothetical protein [Desulfosudis oleivorans]